MLKSHYQDIARNQDKHWWYLGMIAINISILDYYLGGKENLKILDAGCGPGANLPHLKKYGDVIGVDLSKEALKFARERGKVQKGDITKLKFNDNSFDLVVCMDVLYHMWIKDVSLALKEFNRVLKKDGKLLLREPAYNWMRGNEDRGSLTARRFSKREFRMRLEKNGFIIKKLTYVNFFLFPIVLVVRLLTMLGIIKGSSDMTIPTRPVNLMLYNSLKLESFLIRFLNFPFGSSLICLARVKKQ